MAWYEIIYETGRTSVAFYDDDDEANRAVGEQHRRAVAGEPGGPLGVPAERVKAVFVYDKHPNEYNPDQTMTADVAKKELASLVDSSQDENGVVAIDQLALGVAGLSHPMVVSKKPFESNFKMKEARTLTLKLEG